MRARVLRSAKRSFICEILETKEVVEAPALATLLKEDHIVVGDFVNLTLIEKDSKEYQIVEREERKNEIYRLIPREQKKKVTASNCDLLVVITSISLPEYKRGLVDRYLTRAFQWRIPAILVFNKMDEYDDQLDLDFEASRLDDIDVDCFEVSAVNKKYKAKFLPGIKDLRESLKGKTAIMLGQSGVGKSELITTLSDGKAKLLSGELGKVGKGAHTTTWSEIVNCGDFYLIDSPGVRSFSIDDIHLDELDGVFPDIADYATKCKFRNCAHTEEDVGCYFNELDMEDDKSLMILGRLESYLKFKDELGRIPDWSKKK